MPTVTRVVFILCVVKAVGILKLLNKEEVLDDNPS